MAKRKYPKGQVNKSNKKTLEAVKNLMEDLGQKYSIKVGILKASPVKGADINTAELAAIHEFGATINVTPKMRGWFYHNFGIQKSNEPIKIPARPFLRPLLDKKNQEIILDSTILTEDRELNKLVGEGRLEQNSKFLENIAHTVAETATLAVQHAFNAGGYPNKWKDITPFSRENRKYNHESPPLTDTGQLQQSISYEIKKAK